MRRWALLPLLLVIGCRGDPAAPDPVVRFEGQGLGVAWDEVPKGDEARRQARAAAREGARLLEAGDEARALAHLRRAVDLDPRELGGWRSLAGGFERLGDVDAALRVVREAQKAWPREPGLLYDLGRLIRQSRKASAPDPALPAGDDVEGTLLAGNELMERGEFAEAARAYGNAVRRRPGDAEARRLLGGAYFRAGDYRAAVAAWEELSRRRKLDGETARLLDEARRRSR
jgi:tetratricopeptide (TPR) repeat protein